jgi:hypothetical protein
VQVRVRLTVSALEERWVPASPPAPTGPTGPTGTTPTAAQLAAAAQAATTQTPAATTPVAPSFLPDRAVSPGVTLVTATGTAGSTVSLYDSTFTGGVWVARADVTGDGTPDAVAAPGVGIAPTVNVVDGADGRVVRSFAAYEKSFTGGVLVAAADMNGDGRAEIVTGTDTGGGPRVRVFDGLTNAVIADFLAIDDPDFRGGVRVAVGDVSGDGVPDLVAAAGFGGGPRVAVWDGKALLRGVQVRVTADFFAFEPALRNGVYPAVGAYNADRFADILIGAGPGGGPRVKAISGELLTNGPPQAAADSPLIDYFAGLADDRGGVRVGAVPGTTAAATVFNILTVGGSGGAGTVWDSTRRGVQSVARETALGGGLLADATGQRLFTGNTPTGTGSGLGSGVNVGTSLQQLLDSLAGLGG